MIYSSLIDAATLAARLDHPEWQVVDVRHQLLDVTYGEKVFAESHIPGAVFLHCDRDLSGPMTGLNGRHPLPAIDVFVKTLAQNGIGARTQVVVYDDAQGMIAGRLWWLLRSLGHPAVAVLDGGWQAWVAAGLPLTQVLAQPGPALFEAQTLAGVCSVDAVMDNLQQDNHLLVDARSPDRFRGENETIDPVGGHIPGAVNRFFRDNLQADGRFKSAVVLRAEWLELLAGRSPEQVIHQCGSGVSACHNVLSMEIAGLSGSQLYAGSWSEWCVDPSRPVAR